MALGAIATAIADTSVVDLWGAVEDSADLSDGAD
jgi:hypothetical protein